ncbi:calcium-binding protein P-like [Lates japonicus]
MMGRLCEAALVSLLIISLLHTESTWAKRGGGFSSKKTSSSSSRGGTQPKPSSSQPASYPRQPQSPNRNTNPYPSGGSYPYPGTGTNSGGYPKQNPASYPGAGSYPNQNPGRANPGGYPNQNPAGGYPAAGGYPNQYPAAGGYPNQYPGRAGTNQGGYPNQYPAAGGYPNQYPGRAGTNQGGYPNQYPGGGGGYQYPAAGGYPVRGGNTGQGWGLPGGNPGGYPGGAIGGYPNWNPNNKILSPRFGGGGYGYGGYGMGGSPFSRSVQSMGYQPKSTGFAKKALVAAGVGAVAGMAVGYGLGRFPRPHFSFRNPEEEYYYNNYMYRRYGTHSTDEKDYGRDYVYKPPPRAESYDNFMDRCMNKTDLLKDQGNSSPSPKSGGNEEDDDTVSIEEIGYPALIEQLKARRCVEQYMVYSERFLEERKAERQIDPGNNSPMNSAPSVIQLFASIFMLLSSILLLQ